MKNGVEVCQEIKNIIPMWLSNPTPKYIYKGNKNTTLKKHLQHQVCCHTHYNSKTGKQPNCPSTDQWINGEREDPWREDYLQHWHFACNPHPRLCIPECLHGKAIIAVLQPLQKLNNTGMVTLIFYYMKMSSPALTVPICVLNVIGLNLKIQNTSCKWQFEKLIAVNKQ